MVLLVLHVLVLTLAGICLHLTYSFKTRPNRGPVVLIRILLSLVFLHILNSFLFHFCIVGYQYLSWSLPLGLLYGPILYINAKLEDEGSFDKKYLLHFLPFFLGIALYFTLMLSFSYREQYGQLHYLLLHVVVGISFFSYSVWRMRTSDLARDRIRATIHFSFIGLALTTIIVQLGEIFLQIEGYSSVQTYVWNLGILVILLCVYQLLVDGLRAPSLTPVEESILVDFPQQVPMETIVNEAEEEKVGNWRSYRKKIENYMEGHPYLDEEFNVKKMAAELNIPRYVLNEFFAEHYQETFAKRINLFRVDYACSELSGKYYELNIDELWKRCGFRSRASFYRNFSQVKGCTPLEYRNTVLTK